MGNRSISEQFPACATCPRNDGEEGQSAEILEAANAHLQFFAADAAGNEAGSWKLEPTPAQHSVNSNNFAAQAYFGAVSLCAYRIGTEKCPKWGYQWSDNAVIPASEIVE